MKWTWRTGLGVLLKFQWLSVRSPGRLAGLAAACLLTVGCSTAQIDQIPASMGGLPEGTPARPAVAPAFPAVHDMPPQRAQPLLDEDEQKRLEQELIRARNRNTGQSRNP
jgi:hypothetical protein